MFGLEIRFRTGFRITSHLRTHHRVPRVPCQSMPPPTLADPHTNGETERMDLETSRQATPIQNTLNKEAAHNIIKERCLLVSIP